LNFLPLARTLTFGRTLHFLCGVDSSLAHGIMSARVSVQSII
jgi:hypothetical protein